MASTAPPAATTTAPTTGTGGGAAAGQPGAQGLRIVKRSVLRSLPPGAVIYASRPHVRLATEEAASRPCWRLIATNRGQALLIGEDPRRTAVCPLSMLSEDPGPPSAIDRAATSLAAAFSGTVVID